MYLPTSHTRKLVWFIGCVCFIVLMDGKAITIKDNIIVEGIQQPPHLKQPINNSNNNINSLSWFNQDPPGIENPQIIRYPSSSTNEDEDVQSTWLLLRRIWAHELSLTINSSRTSFHRSHPQLIFIKGFKTGGTSIATALDRAALRYNISILSNLNAIKLAQSYEEQLLLSSQSNINHHHPHQQTPTIPLMTQPLKQISLLENSLENKVKEEGCDTNTSHNNECSTTTTTTTTTTTSSPPTFSQWTSQLQSSIFYHHAQKSPWMDIVIPHARYITLLRDPLEQELSGEMFKLNKEYHNHYPSQPCNPLNDPSMIDKTPTENLTLLFNLVSTCVDRVFREKLSVEVIGRGIIHHHQQHLNRNHDINNNNYLYASPLDDSLKPSLFDKDQHFHAVARTARFLIPKSDSRNLIEILSQDYFLVGITERLNEFLVVLALHQGWDVSSLYYRKCKVTDMKINIQDFARKFPNRYREMESQLLPMKQAYEWAKNDFDNKIKQLPSWFGDLVQQFNQGLVKYQLENQSPHTPFLWEKRLMGDGSIKVC
jgi:hypothetical protein